MLNFRTIFLTKTCTTTLRPFLGFRLALWVDCITKIQGINHGAGSSSRQREPYAALQFGLISSRVSRLMDLMMLAPKT